VSSTSDGAAALVFDVTDAGFQTDVIERSHRTPVVVDLWAEWCGPCRTLGPMLERLVTARGGDVVLAKVDTDANPGVAQAFRVQSIPAVFGIRDGQVVAQFVGVRPEPELERFLDDLAPSEADEAVQRARVLTGADREQELRRALELDPGHREAAIALAELLVESDPDAAFDLVVSHRPDPAAEAVATRVELARGNGSGDLATLRAEVAGGREDGATLLALGRALAAAGEYEEALERLLAAVQLGGDTREAAREQIVALFNVLGDADPRVQSARPRLARALF
jgi:putative thioredoxin